MPQEYQSKHKYTPETVLAGGLRSLGVEVSVASHSSFRPSQRYDVVHVHHLGKAAVRMASTISQAKFVFTPHDGFLLCGYDRSLVRKAAFRYVLSRCDAVVALSEVEAKFLQEHNRGNDAAMALIPNGIPADVFRLETAPRKNNTYNLLFVGSLASFKGADILLRTIPNLEQQWNLTLSLIYQYNGLESQYKALATDLGIADRTKFLGLLSAEDIGTQYCRADITVLPSYAEDLPSVITESLLCGTPVVATAVGGIPDQIGPYGVVVPPGSVDELAAGIDRVLQQLSKFKTMRREMREYAMNRFNVEKMIQSHLELYHRLSTNRPIDSRKGGKRIVDGIFSLALKIKG